MKGLKTLIRINKLKLEDQQRQLAELEGTSGVFRSQIAAMEESMRRESELADQNPDAAHTVGGFVQSTLARRGTLQASLAEIEKQVTLLRDAVATAFREIKRFELIMERREDAARRKAGRQERKVEDETALAVFRRGQRVATG
ncbi:MAG: flagellar FliJ protein [Alphaproteobacteria bacterium]|jgi:flagellar FliJ protein